MRKDLSFNQLAKSSIGWFQRLKDVAREECSKVALDVSKTITFAVAGF